MGRENTNTHAVCVLEVSLDNDGVKEEYQCIDNGTTISDSDAQLKDRCSNHNNQIFAVEVMGQSAELDVLSEIRSSLSDTHAHVILHINLCWTVLSQRSSFCCAAKLCISKRDTRTQMVATAASVKPNRWMQTPAQRRTLTSVTNTDHTKCIGGLQVPLRSWCK